ncbi:MAG: hypothetical protein NTW71_12095 [Deltaproteobacteria bacterium]|nr:hypothetical protein [Deltaproteobacteria bacterium]
MPLFYFPVYDPNSQPTLRGKRRVSAKGWSALRPLNMAPMLPAEAVEKMKPAPLDSDRIFTARDRGIRFGDD